MVSSHDLSVGHEDIDAEHATIVRRFEEINRAVGEEDAAALGVALARLWDDSIGHFATEEALMESFAYPERVAHHSAHQLFIEDLKSLVREQQARGVDEEIANWALLRVPEWFAFHVQTNDAPLARFIARKTAARLMAAALGEERPDPRRKGV